ncbi:hypothetical protein HEK616_81520 (plasmid) [Streptomyces nigrescens]|uniref:Uncharacterized protein n=1 Tax=Streptomyces nigrescens TaxID=1920 RepID=A0ABN6R8G5_STRNI|nr:hypothetical protein HEK616_81520 [Streptomyces nigrescens]
MAALGPHQAQAPTIDRALTLHTAEEITRHLADLGCQDVRAGAVTPAASRTPPANTAHVYAITRAVHSQEANTITGTTNIEWTAETTKAARAQPPPVTRRRTVAQ